MRSEANWQCVFRGMDAKKEQQDWTRRRCAITCPDRRRFVPAITPRQARLAANAATPKDSVLAALDPERTGAEPLAQAAQQSAFCHGFEDLFGTFRIKQLIVG